LQSSTSLNRIENPHKAAPEVAAVAFCAAVGADGLGVGVCVALEEVGQVVSFLKTLSF
jgi:hypothetical protein